MTAPVPDNSFRPPRGRWLTSIRVRTFVLLAVVLGVLTSAHVFGVRAFARFARLQSVQELISDQAARVQEVELRLVRRVNGAEAPAELQAVLERFSATLTVLCQGGSIMLGERSILCTPPDDADSVAQLDAIRQAWTLQRERIQVVLTSTAQRASACQTLQRDGAPFLAELGALEQQLRKANRKDAADLAAEARQWASRLQTASSQVEAQLGGDGLDQAVLSLSLASDKLAALLSALRDGSEDLEVDALADAADREKLALADAAFTPLRGSAAVACGAAKELKSSLADVSERSAELRRMQTELWVRNGARTASELARFERLQLTVLGVVGALILVFGVYLYRALLRPILRLRDLLTDIARGDGDLTQTLDIQRNDEIGDLAARFNEFTAKLRALVRDMAGCIERLAQSSAQVKDISAHMSEGVRLTEAHALEVIEGIAAIDRDFSAVVEGAGGVERCSGDIRSSCVGTSEEVQRSVTLSAGVRKDIDELALAAGGIKSVLHAIQEISLRVKLLSLNAAIEAAHAGDAGRSFAVVATEVRTLANQTEERTGHIDATIRGLVEVCDRSNRSFQSVDDSIARIQERQVSACRAADDQVEASTRMRDSLASTQKASDSVRQSAGELRSNVRNAAQAAQATRAAADDLDALSSDLSTMVSQFRY